jgi:hypothetical protein
MAELVWRLIYADKAISGDQIDSETGKPYYIGSPVLAGALELQVLNTLGVLLAQIQLPKTARPIAFRRRIVVFSQNEPLNDVGSEFFFGYQITEEGRNRKLILHVAPDGVVRITENDGRE